MKKILTVFVIASALTISSIVPCEKDRTLKKVSYIFEYLIRKIDEGIFAVTIMEINNALEAYLKEFGPACPRCQAFAYLNYQPLINRLKAFIEAKKNKSVIDDSHHSIAEQKKDKFTLKIIRIIKRKIHTQAHSNILSGIDQTKALALKYDDLSSLCLERLVEILHDLGQNVMIKIKPKHHTKTKCSKRL